MKPVVFDGHFGWLHFAAGSRGVVLCKPPGHETQWLHQTFLAMGQQFAQNGVPTLRFDYRSTGDSIDDTSESPTLDVWLAGIASAIAYLREIVGIEHVTLCGMRLGATLAALAAEQGGADGLILLAPVASGRSYLREAKMMQKVWLDRAPAAVRADQLVGEHTELLGQYIDAPSTSRLHTLNLSATEHRPAPRILILQPDERDTAALALRYRELGAQVDLLPFPEYPSVMHPTWRSAVPHDAIAAAAAWASFELPARKSAVPNSDIIAVGDVALFTQEAFEQTVSIGPGRLFGMLCQPLQRTAESVEGARPPWHPAILISNTGATSHVGEARFGVFLARHLARSGYTSLRIDATGVGDSLQEADAEAAELTLDAMCTDLVSATDWLMAQGHTEVITVGICSGAYLGLHAALVDTRISAVMAINLEQFVFAPGTTLLEVGNANPGSTRAHLRSLFKVKKWQEVLRGQTPLAPVLRSLARHAFERMGGYIARLTDGMIGASKAHTVARHMLNRLDQRGMRLRLLYSPLDIGLDEIKSVFGSSRKRLGKLRHASVSVLDNMDHEVLSTKAREAIAQHCEQLLDDCREAAQANCKPPPLTQQSAVAARSHLRTRSHSLSTATLCKDLQPAKRYAEK